VMKLRKALDKNLSPTARDSVLRSIRELERRGGTADLMTFLQSVELTANRAGAALAGDLPLIARRVASETRVVAGVTPDARRGDLFSYFASSAHSALRMRLGIAARPSAAGPLVPPTPAGPPGPPPRPGSFSG